MSLRDRKPLYFDFQCLFLRVISTLQMSISKYINFFFDFCFDLKAVSTPYQHRLNSSPKNFNTGGAPCWVICLIGLYCYLCWTYLLITLILTLMDNLTPDLLQAFYMVISFIVGLFINPKKRKTGD